MKETFFEFHVALMGYKIHKKNKQIDKYIAYWLGIPSDDILSNRTPYQIN
jgi:hypothetical protein